MHVELNNIRQIFFNNNFSKNSIDYQRKLALKNLRNDTSTHPDINKNKNRINLFYRNQTHLKNKDENYLNI